jgi:PAS domain S-box-containing protein
MTFSKKFLFLPLVIVLFFFLFYLVYRDVKNRVLDEFNNQQFALANQASRGIESFFISYQRELYFLSKLKSVNEFSDHGKDLLTEFYKTHSDQIEAITLVDSNGILRYTYPLNSSVVGRDISNQKHVKAVMETHKPTVSDVFTSVQGFRAIAYHIPIIRMNEYLGSIAILIPLDKLGKRFIENIKTGETGYGSMISENGIELYNPLPGFVGKSAKEIYVDYPSVLDMIEKTPKLEDGTSVCFFNSKSESNKKSAKIFAGFHLVTLDNTHWTIIVFTPVKEIYATLTNFQNYLYLLFSIIVIVMIFYFYLSMKASEVLTEEKKRRAVEEVLIESEKRFRAMFELSPSGICLMDKAGTIIEVNTSFCDTLGYSRNELTGKNVRLFSYTILEGEIENNITQLLEGKTLIHEVTDLRKDGTLCILALYETMIILPDGKQGILSVSNDITEIKHSQEKMLMLSRALESIGECVSITDINNKIVYVNKAFCKTYGYNREEIIGKNIEILRRLEPKKEQSEEILSETISGGWNGELLNIRKDGSEFPIQLSTSPILDDKGNLVALIGIAVDITERKKAQDELIASKEKAVESDRLKSAFLANISHELRTPLNAIIGFSNIMQEKSTDDDSSAYSKIIFDSGYHLLSLVEDILDNSMIETGQFKIHNEEVEINSMLSEVKNIIHGEILKEDKTNIDLILNSDAETKEIYTITDGRKLKQVLINLLKNGLKFTDKGCLEFGFTEIEKGKDKYLKFYVKDSGIGIDKKHHEVIFNVFRQIDDTHTRKFGGTGIGLSIAKKIVELLEGEIWVESELEKGSVFYFTIPVRNEKSHTKADPINKPNITENRFNGKTILIAEDEKTSFDFLRMYFKRINIKVLWAKNGYEAIEICETDKSVNLILMDIKMPLLNGYDATRRIKEIRPDLPIIAQTAHAMTADKEEALKSGCNDYLSKPINTYQLMDILQKYL